MRHWTPMCIFYRYVLVICGRAATKCSEPPLQLYVFPSRPCGRNRRPSGEPRVGSGRFHTWALVRERVDCWSTLFGQIGVVHCIWVDWGRLGVDYVMGRLIWDYQESADFYLRVADEVVGGVAWELAERHVGSCRQFICKLADLSADDYLSILIITFVIYII